MGTTDDDVEGCTVCHYITGHQPYCPSSGPRDWQNLAEPWRTELAQARAAEVTAAEQAEATLRGMIGSGRVVVLSPDTDWDDLNRLAAAPAEAIEDEP
jgi:hypothetical protein